MPITDPLNVHVNRPLTDLSVGEFQTEAARYPALAVAPLVPSRHLSDVYYELDRGDLVRLEMGPRVSGAEADAAGYDLTTTAFTLDRWALKKPTGFDEIANQDEVLQLEETDMQYLIQQWLLRMSERAVATLLTTGVWTGSTTGADLVAGDVGGAWTAAGGGVPVVAIHNQRESIKQRSMQNLDNRNFHLFCGSDVYQILREHGDIESKFTGVQVGIMDEQKIAQALNIGGVHVVDTIRNTAAEGAADVSAYLMDQDDAALVYVAPRPGKKTFSAAYTFVGAHRAGLSPLGHMIKSWDDQVHDAHITELNAYFRHIVVAATGGAYFNEIV